MSLLQTVQTRIKRIQEGKEKASLMETVLTLPLALLIFFMFVNFSTYFSLYSEVNNHARDGARLVALYGGADADAVRNMTGKSVAELVTDNLWRDGDCTLSFCTQPPIVVCSPGGVTSDPVQAGDFVECSITYFYTPVAPLWGLNVLEQPISVTATFVSETGSG